MKVTFAGVGAAIDESQPNTSIVLEHGQWSILLDCGFDAAHAFFRYAENPHKLAAVWISHFHGDHFFGVPALLLRFHEENRSRPLVFVGQRGLESIIKQCVDLAYPSLRDTIRFALKFVEVETRQETAIGDFKLRFAQGDHGKPCLAVRAEADGRSVFYSGDGKPTPQTAQLAHGADLLVHESFALGDWEGHGSVAGAVLFAKQAEAKRLAAVHVNRTIRKEQLTEVLRVLTEADWVDAFLPEPGDTVEL